MTIETTEHAPINPELEGRLRSYFAGAYLEGAALGLGVSDREKLMHRIVHEWYDGGGQKDWCAMIINHHFLLFRHSHDHSEEFADKECTAILVRERHPHGR